MEDYEKEKLKKMQVLFKQYKSLLQDLIIIIKSLTEVVYAILKEDTHNKLEPTMLDAQIYTRNLLTETLKDLYANDKEPSEVLKND